MSTSEAPLHDANTALSDGHEQLARFARFVQAQHLEAAAEEQLRLNRAIDVPLLRLFRDMPEPQLLALAVQGLDTFLNDLAEGRALQAAAESLRLWEADQLPGIPKDAIEPSDMVLVYTSQEQALLKFLPAFTSDVAEAVAVAMALHAHYARVQDEAFQLFARLRDEAAARAARLDLEREAAESAAEEFQALNEELQSQQEELQSQQEELQALYDQQRRHAEQLEQAVVARTEELQGANEELTMQSEELQQQQTLLQTVLDAMPGNVGFSDAQGVIRLVNSRFAASYGKRPEDFIGRPVGAMFPEQAAAIEGLVKQVLTTGEAWRAHGVPMTVEGPDGPVETFRDSTIVPVFDATGRPDGVLSLSIDVSDRVRLERALQTEQALVRQIVDNAPAGVALLDAGLTTRWINPEMLSLFGKQADFFLDRDFLHAIKPEARVHFEGLLRQVLSSGEPFHATAVPYEFNGPAPRLTHWDFSYIPVPGPDGKPHALLVFALEVSDRVAHEQLQRDQISHLQQADRYKDEFLSVLSHELRTPLNFIMGFSSVLGDGVAGVLNGEQLACVEKILGGADRMLTLVDDLLDVAKIQSGKLELHPAPVRYDGLVQGVVAELAPLADKKRVSLRVEAAPEVHPVVDAGRITQVLTNLLSNAIKFTQAEGQIQVRVRLDGEVLRTEVADTGPGIPLEDQALIFERFRQLDMGRTRKVGGTGLGLAIAKALVEAHQGTIGVTSEPGHGATFYFTLPVQTAPQG